MNTRDLAPLLPLAALLLLVGCQDIKQRSYSVDVKNESAMPVTVWLTKDGPLWEKSWRSPEQVAYESKGAGEMVAGEVVPPGKLASVQMAGKFTPRSNAILRVYLGEHNMSDLLAISGGSTDRRDYVLDPGYNGFRVVDRDGVTLVERSHGRTSMSADSQR